VVRLIKKWLHAGVLEDGRLTRSEIGTVQGGSISPLLSNIYLHYAFDLWVRQWRARHGEGDMIVVRYVDDGVAGFQYSKDAERFRREVTDRLAHFGLKLHEGKTRLIEFGRFARQDCQREGRSKPQTFDFLGFTHCCGQTRKGRFAVVRLISAKRMRAKLGAVKEELRRRMHQSIPEQGEYSPHSHATAPDQRAASSGEREPFARWAKNARVRAFAPGPGEKRTASTGLPALVVTRIGASGSPFSLDITMGGLPALCHLSPHCANATSAGIISWPLRVST
jgi:hypothetical protein